VNGRHTVGFLSLMHEENENLYCSNFACTHFI
jgi:hypothetical protein